MGYEDYYWGLFLDYCRDPFPHSLLSTRQTSWTKGPGFVDVEKLCGLRALGYGLREDRSCGLRG